MLDNMIRSLSIQLNSAQAVFGRLQEELAKRATEVDHLRAEVDSLRAENATLKDTLAYINDSLSDAA